MDRMISKSNFLKVVIRVDENAPLIYHIFVLGPEILFASPVSSDHILVGNMVASVGDTFSYTSYTSLWGFKKKVGDIDREACLV